MNSLGANKRTFHGDPRPKISEGKNEHGDWLAQQIAKKPEKVRAAETGMTPKAIGNIRQKRNKMSFDNFCELCISDPDIAAQFAVHVGLLLPHQVDLSAAMTRFANELMRHG